MSLNSDDAKIVEESMDSVKCENTACEKNAAKLLTKVDEYRQKLDECAQKIEHLENKIKVITEDRDSQKSQVVKLEKDLSDAIKLPEAQEILSLKNNSEDMLTRAKGLIFEKTKICKNQELQIEALNQQVNSLKEVVAITKDLLDIRNMETKHLQDKLEGMEGKIACEKERHELMHKKMERMLEMNGDLKREYESQLCLFNALREKYSERELARGVLQELRNSSGDATVATTSSDVQAAGNSNVVQNGTGDNVPAPSQNESPTRDKAAPN